jgi:hypothetical protein
MKESLDQAVDCNTLEMICTRAPPVRRAGRVVRRKCSRFLPVLRLHD